MNYSEAIDFLGNLSLFGMNPGLDNTLRLTALAGNPQNQLRFIHVAGTNGKGSTCAMLESIYRVSGLRVGLFTSPHLVSFRERIQVNRKFIPEEDVARLAERLKDWVKDGWSRADAAHPTFFEVVTVMALQYFAEQKCDLVIWETGLGGRLDATNIVTPLASVITNIGFDHQRWLGDTLAKIAAEKAGIVKPGVPVITTTDNPEALEVIQRTAMKLNAPLTVVRTCDVQNAFLTSSRLPLFGAHQKINAALALATVRALQDRLPVTDELLQRGLETVEWPGRFQVILKSGGRTIVLDGAHNTEGALALRDAMKSRFPGIRPTLVLGVLKDKDQSGICAALAPLAGRILLTAVNSERTASPDLLSELCAKANPSAELETCDSLAQALEKAAADPLVLIAGSLYLIGEAMELLEVPGPGIANERGLNEWNRKK
jgi:dihydrofolate synthase / folylpolyglutamate synthase